MEKIEFEKIKDELTKRIQEKSDELFPGEKMGFTLIEGFLNLELQNELIEDLVIGGPTVPIISIIGNHSGRIYLFALKAIMPELKI